MALCPNCGEDNPPRARFCLACAQVLTTSDEATKRRTVTIVFSDLVGSTSLGERLDPEVLREVLDRYFSEMRTVLERHEGAVEKYIGDAVMAVFGLPRAHEDDAIRAVRAAIEMRDRLTRLNEQFRDAHDVELAARTGVYTGEVVAGDPATGQRLVTGDAVNTAARLEQAAGSGDVVIGHPTFRLARHAVEAEEIAPVAAKGKTKPVRAYRVTRLARPTETPFSTSPLIGRRRELSSLQDAFRACKETGESSVIGVVGAPGAGKSRLVSELRRWAADDAIVLTGRAIAYGEAITFWPLRNLLFHAAGIEDRDSAEIAVEKIRASLDGLDEATRMALAAAAGLIDDAIPVEQITWAARNLLQWFAPARPLVVVLEDLHWAEPAFLDLVHQLATNPIPRSVFVLITARPELHQLRPEWTTADAPIRMQHLEPLSEEDGDALVHSLLGSDVSPELLGRIRAATEGNPLFIEQLVSMLVEDGALVSSGGMLTTSGDQSTFPMPPTVSALLSARIDRLSSVDRTVIEVASVPGQEFRKPALTALLPAEASEGLDSSLSRLVDAEFLARQGEDRTDEYRFRHELIRDAAYAGMLKRTRADLHERFATWLEQDVGDRVPEYEELLGHHLERAFQILAELGVRDERTASIGVRGGHHLFAAGARAHAREDARAATSLLSRAAALLPTQEPIRSTLHAFLAEALFDSGHAVEAGDEIDRAIALARDAADERAELRAKAVKLEMREFTDPGFSRDVYLREASRIIEQLEPLGDAAGLAKAYSVKGALITDGRFEAGLEAIEKTIQYAMAAGDAKREALERAFLVAAHTDGPTPVAEVIPIALETLEWAHGKPAIEGRVVRALGVLLGMQGRFDEALEAMDRSAALFEQLGLQLSLAATLNPRGTVRLLMDDLAGAEADFRRAYESIRDGAGVGLYTYFAASDLAEVLCLTNRVAEADALTAGGEITAGGFDLSAVCTWRLARAHVLALNSHPEAGETLAGEAIDELESSGFLNMQGLARKRLAEILRIEGRTKEAGGLFREALTRFERKGNEVLGAKIRAIVELPAKDDAGLET